MIFKYLIGFFYLLFTSTLYADVTINNVKKDAKVIGNVSVSQAVLSEQVGEAGAVDKKSAKVVADEWKLYAEQWELTRSGEYILSLPVLKKVVTSWLQDKQKIIEIQYPGGEEGEFWVQELMDWLVSLGIPTSHVLAVPGSGADDVINFALVR